LPETAIIPTAEKTDFRCCCGTGASAVRAGAGAVRHSFCLLV